MKPLLIITPILLIGGILGAGFMGIVPIPGISPKKAVAKSSEMYGEGKEETTTLTQDEPVEDQEYVEPPPTAPEPTVTQVQTTTQTITPARDPEKGARALAKYWDEIEINKLIPITETYKDPELAQVLYFMQKAKVAELLSRVRADRAASLSRELQRLASIVKPEASP